MAPTELFRRGSQRSVPPALVAVVLLLIAGRAAFTLQRDRGHSAVRWVEPEQALAVATAENKPILYDFTAEWCGPCHLLEDAVFDDPVLASTINRRFIPVRVVDRQREEGANPAAVDSLQRRYSVVAFPTVVVAGVDGIPLGRMEGFRGRDEFEQLLNGID